MLPCLLTNEVCPNTNKKCKNCSLDECKEVINMIEEHRNHEDRMKLKRLKEQLPARCRNCSFLQIINVEQNKVYCSYMIKDNCLVINTIVNNIRKK